MDTPVATECTPLLQSRDNQHTNTYSVDEALDIIGCGFFQINVFVFSGLLRAFRGIADLQLALLLPSWQCEFKLTNSDLAVLAAMFPLGNLIGATPMGLLSDRYGRKNVVNIGNIFLLYFSILSAFVPGYAWLIFLRFLMGFFGVASSMGSTYCVEFMPVKYRSPAVLFLSFFWTIGTCVLVLFSYIIIPTLGWRTLVCVINFPIIIIPIYYWFVPTSPRFLLQRGRVEEARRILESGARLNCRHLPEGELVRDYGTPENLTQHGQSTKLPIIPQHNLGIADMLSKKYRLTSLLLALIWFTCGLLVYGTILMTSDIYTYDHHCPAYNNSNTEEVHTTHNYCNPLEATDYMEYLITTAAEIPGVIVTAIAVQFIGRKPAFVTGFLISGVAYFLLLVCTPHGHTVKTVLLFTIRASNAGVFDLAYLYTGEVYPTRVRATTLSVLSSLTRVATILTGFLAEVLLRSSYVAAIGILGTVAVATALASAALPYETKGRKLE